MEEVLFFHQRLRRYRAATGASQQRIADKLSIKRSAYASYEEARAEPPLKVLRAMASLFSCSLDELVGFNSEEAPRSLTKPKPERKQPSGRKPLMRRNPSPALSSLPSARPFTTWP